MVLPVNCFAFYCTYGSFAVAAAAAGGEFEADARNSSSMQAAGKKCSRE